MLKLTQNDSVYYLKDSVVYGFCVFPVSDGYKLRLLDTTEDGYYDLGVFKNKEICEQIIHNIKKAVVDIIDIDFIIQKELEYYK